jgi:hypothetical protein
MNITVFRYVTPCSSVDMCQRFGKRSAPIVSLGTVCSCAGYIYDVLSEKIHAFRISHLLLRVGFVATVILLLLLLLLLLLFIAFMQAIYNYLPLTNNVSRVYSVSAILYL